MSISAISPSQLHQPSSINRGDKRIFAIKESAATPAEIILTQSPGIQNNEHEYRRGVDRLARIR